MTLSVHFQYANPATVLKEPGPIQQCYLCACNILHIKNNFFPIFILGGGVDLASYTNTERGKVSVRIHSKNSHLLKHPFKEGLRSGVIVLI